MIDRDATITRNTLASTSFADLNDREILAWIRAAVRWIGSNNIPIDFEDARHIISVLGTCPWGMIATEPYTKITRKIMIWFERLCFALIDFSPKLVTLTLEAAFMPFTAIPPEDFSSIEGKVNMRLFQIPLHTITRIVNHAATKYPDLISTDILVHSLEAHFPQRRWPLGFQHEAYINMILTLALDAQLSDSSSLVSCFEEIKAQVTGDEYLGNGYGGSGQCSTAGETDSTRTSICTSATESDVFSLHCDVGSAARGSMGSFFSASGGFQQGTPTLQLSGDNKLVKYQIRLIGLVLTKLMEMELSVEHEDYEEISSIRNRPALWSKLAPQNHQPVHNKYVANLLGEKRGRDDDEDVGRNIAATTSNLVNCSNTTGLCFFFETLSEIDLMRNTVLWDSLINILRRCVRLVYFRLYTYMEHQKFIGRGGERPLWWGEVQAFHCDYISKTEKSIVLHYLAPSLAVLGAAEEATELMHKVVSAVTKGTSQKRVSIVLTNEESQQRQQQKRNNGILRLQHIPTALNSKQRLLSSMHLAPLMEALYESIGAPEVVLDGILRRLFKFVGESCRSARGVPTDEVVESVFMQALSICQLFGRKVDESDDIPDQFLVKFIQSNSSECRSLSISDKDGDIAPVPKDTIIDENDSNNEGDVISPDRGIDAEEESQIGYNVSSPNHGTLAIIPKNHRLHSKSSPKHQGKISLAKKNQEKRQKKKAIVQQQEQEEQAAQELFQDGAFADIKPSHFNTTNERTMYMSPESTDFPHTSRSTLLKNVCSIFKESRRKIHGHFGIGGASEYRGLFTV